MNLDGSGKTALSDPNSSLYAEPHVFSPSGTLLAYADSVGPKLFVVNADGTNRHALTTDSADELRPIFTCDDSRVIFDTMRDGNWEIYSIGVNGTGLTNLSKSPAFDFVAGLSPDCSRILFESERTGNREIFIMNIDGSGPFQLTNNPGEDYSPFFSPDGKKVGFISRPGSSGEFDLWVINTDGTNLHKVSSPASNGATCCPKYQFSSYGNKVLFHSILPGNNFEIFTVNSDGTNLINISNDPASDIGESFKPCRFH
jgi:TolB protein